MLGPELTPPPHYPVMYVQDMTPGYATRLCDPVMLDEMSPESSVGAPPKLPQICRSPKDGEIESKKNALWFLLSLP